MGECIKSASFNEKPSHAILKQRQNKTIKSLFIKSLQIISKILMEKNNHIKFIDFGNI